MILPTKEELDAIDMSDIKKMLYYVPEVDFIAEPAGVNHYRLLRWLTQNKGYTISDIGTYMGFSAMCFSFGNTVYTYDTHFSQTKWQVMPKTVTPILSRTTEWFDWAILESNLIFVDTWHEGKMEKAIYDFLVKMKWKGILIFDDLYYNEAMTAFWNSIPEPKIDATHLGHSTGTGIIEFL